MVEAIGYIVHLVSASQLDSQLPKLLPTIAQLYKKHQEHYYISQCLCMVVDAACKKQCESFQALLDNLLVMLHQHVSLVFFRTTNKSHDNHMISLQASIPVVMSNPVTVKNHNEILRCFAVISELFLLVCCCGVYYCVISELSC